MWSDRALKDLNSGKISASKSIIMSKQCPKYFSNFRRLQSTSPYLTENPSLTPHRKPFINPHEWSPRLVGGWSSGSQTDFSHESLRNIDPFRGQTRFRCNKISSPNLYEQLKHQKISILTKYRPQTPSLRSKHASNYIANLVDLSRPPPIPFRNPSKLRNQAV